MPVVSHLIHPDPMIPRLAGTPQRAVVDGMVQDPVSARRRDYRTLRLSPVTDDAQVFHELHLEPFGDRGMMRWSREDDDAQLVVKMAIAPADNILDVDLVDSFLCHLYPPLLVRRPTLNSLLHFFRTAFDIPRAIRSGWG